MAPGQRGTGDEHELERARSDAGSPALATVEAHWRVTGRVQGVGFRWFARQQARRWGVRGWVRNLPDGSVEIAAQGSADAIEGLLAAVRRGPPGAEVADIEKLSSGGLTEFPDPFSILRG